jgi:pyrimidine operon attenuation protein / uracil phosphoribosyltransferase
MRRILLQSAHFDLVINRLCQQLIETYDDFSNTCFVAIQPRGTFLADRIVAQLSQDIDNQSIDYGKLDITFYRDDFKRSKPQQPLANEMNFLVEGKRVILIDDVLYTGRTVQAALTALNHYGRPESVELLALVDRRFNRHLPIQSDYIGITIDVLDEEYVKVEWKATTGADSVVLFPNKEASKKE